MANGKPNTARRREVRKSVQRPAPPWFSVVHRREAGHAVLFTLLLVGLCAVINLPHRQALPYQANQIVTRPVVARVGFEAVDQERTQNQRAAARANAPSVYTANHALYQKLEDRFVSLIRLADMASINEVGDDERARQKIDRAAFEAIKNYGQSDEKMAEWEAVKRDFLRRVFDLAILRAERYEAERLNDIGKIRIVHPDPPPEQPAQQIIYPSVWISTADARTLRERLDRFAVHFPEALRPAVIEAVMSTTGPTYLYDEVKTIEAREEAYRNAKPEYTKYARNTVFIAPGEKITSNHLDLLEAERDAYHAWLAAAGAVGEDRPNYPLLAQRPMLAEIGYIGVLLMIAAGLWVYVFRYYPRIAANPMRGLAITVLLALALGLSVATAGILPMADHIYGTLPTLLVVMVLAIVYDRRFALFIGGLHILLTAISLDLSMGFACVALAGVGVTAALLGDVRSRSKLVTTGLYAGLAMAVAAFIVALAEAPLDIPNGWSLVGHNILLAAGSGFIAGLLVQGILPLIERVFRVTTTMTLKELNDASHPLLQRLAQDAPGTYQHSLRLADITEAAAEAIGADGLLCRVGAMYHDIGKMNKPLYFIENQGGEPNKHNKLSPAMSLLIIVGHVKDGIEMAREFALPQVLRHFIESHHGTTLVEYFYHAARKQQEEAEKPAPSEFEFRYPGPKPQTKEAAIMLLSDGIEAAARTIDEPTPIRLEQLVHNIAMKRLMDGQFDECALTLQDLARAEAAINKTLCAIYHARVKYPGGERKKAEPVQPPQPAAPPAKMA